MPATTSTSTTNADNKAKSKIVAPSANSTVRLQLPATPTEGADPAAAANESAIVPAQAQEEAKDNSNTDNSNNKNEDSPDALNNRPLYKSPRFKGYLTMTLASIIGYSAAWQSKDTLDPLAVPASTRQRRYALACSLTSAITAGCLVLIHLDHITPLKRVWRRYFAPKARVELSINIWMGLWWLVATCIQTSVRGIAGDGKDQYNLYYSTWMCMWASLYILDKKTMDFGWPGMRSFITSWPFRAPGWIAIFITCFFTLFWYVDLFLNTSRDRDKLQGTQLAVYGNINESQYEWLLFVASFTLVPSAGFILVEIFRDNTVTEKSQMEIILEGCCLSLLLVGWTPAVCIATTPGGFASLVGNAYFFTWGTTILVAETSLWFVHDFRASVHSVLEQKNREYQKHQRKVLAQAKEIKNNNHNTSAAAQELLNENYETTHEEEEEVLPDLTNPQTTTPRFEANGMVLSESVAFELAAKQDNKSDYYDALEE